MEASLNLLGASVLQQWRNFSCYISVPWEHAALQFNILNWQGTVEEEGEESKAKTAVLWKTKKKKKEKEIIPPPPIANPSQKFTACLEKQHCELQT